MQITENRFVKKLPRTATCTAGGLMLTLVLLYGAAALTAAGMIGGNADTMAAVCAAIGTLTAGFCAARPTGRQILPVGLSAGGMYVLLLAMIGALFFPGTLSADGILPIGAAAIAGSCLGALAASLLPRRRG